MTYAVRALARLAGALIVVAFLSCCAFQMEPDVGLVDGALVGDGDSDSADMEEETPATDGDAETDQGLPDVGVSEMRAEYDFAAGRFTAENYTRVPFPYNYFTVADATKLNGIRLNLKHPENRTQDYFNTNTIDSGLIVVSERYIDHMNTLDGFASFGFVLVEMRPDVDPAGLPATPEESVTDGSLVWLLNVDSGSPSFGARAPIFVESREAKALDSADGTPGEHRFNYLRIRPVRPLDGQTTYAIVLRKGLMTKDGAPLGVSADFARVSGLWPLDEAADDYAILAAERERLAPLFATLKESFDLDAEDLLVAVDFTVQSTTSDLETITREYQAGNLIEPEVNLDSSDPPDGEVDIYTYSTYPDRFPGIPSSLNNPLVGGIIHGVYKAADWRLSTRPTEEQGGDSYRLSMPHDDEGNPVVQGTLDVPFLLILPTSDHPQPFPVVVIQHGIGNQKEGEIGLAPLFLEQGWAVLAPDFVYHGERSGFGYPPLTFINITYPLAAQASFKQAAADHVQLFRLLGSWSLDVFPSGGDGAPDLDGSRCAYLGISLGGIVGSITAGLAPEALGFVLNVGGAGLIDFVADFLEQYGITLVFPDYYMQQFATVAQTALEQGDGVNFTRFYTAPLGENYAPRAVLLQEAIPDDTVPNTVSENLARSASLPHLPPIAHDVYGSPPAASPVLRFGFSQFSPGDHNMIGSGNPDLRAEKERMHRQIVHFFDSLFTTGEGEIIDGTEK
ncbi:MAG: hypothetical protein C4523_12340 [Myxococcales bacterium]|nr:MAG: hypothetical protein C4523_12340 [Myxococcales bacterium]